MATEEQEQATALLLLAVARRLLVRNQRERRRKNRSCWSKDWFKRRDTFSHMPLLQEIQDNNPDDFKNFLRMSDSTFQELLQLVTPLIQRENTHLRRPIPPEQILVATLRFLATGRTLSDLKYSTAISPQALGMIIPDTCDAIIEVLSDQYMKFPSTEEDWKVIVEDFERLWNFPNCGGAIDGKHV
ncbi:uncharacterized protein LOC142107883 [Mixophyes fleayi]|uniref:uncharacterized protein LOC142107883 n=1 Tax=Mixophyes fleayi TaxID=3061075 RepID=UPI003F4D7227